MRHYGECEWKTSVALYERKGKGNKNKILKKKKKNGPTQIYSCEGEGKK